MASAEQIKALLKSHISGDNSHFFSVAMQVAAHEAKLGHGKLAEELRAMIDEAKSSGLASTKPIPITQPRGELASLLSVSYPKLNLSNMILDNSVQERLVRIIKRAATVLQDSFLWIITPPKAASRRSTRNWQSSNIRCPAFPCYQSGAFWSIPCEESGGCNGNSFLYSSRHRVAYMRDSYPSLE